jgi:hypothetical protein
MQNPKASLYSDIQVLINAREPVPGRETEKICQQWRDYSAKLSPLCSEVLLVNDEHIDFIRSRTR